MRRITVGVGAMRFRYFLSSTALLGALLLTSFEAKAVSVTIDSVTGVWTATSPGAPSVTGVGTNQISWGVPAGGPGQSSYTFTGAAPPAQGPYNVGSSFSLGAFTHTNYPIFPPSLTSATLSLTISGKAQGLGGPTAFAVNSIFQFTHTETDNVGPGNCCDDIVNAITNVGGSQIVQVDGINYLFAFTGFQVGGNNFTQFFTTEGQINNAFLLGSFLQPQSVPGEVPLPAALPLFVTGLAALGLVARKRKKKQAT